ncbi:transcriptional repressor LexA [Polymorphobacter fuscus]|uniref:LexA repressor n=1 Tax=Sandarakinorhabdus fusca TaxID=1439888 RepID=A0A7C9GQA9_9SPHN|nr:transcriptional repressor LexA [Polymorphobacter fuscus]KAB7649101.1 transcriptional repressor LexA [Polymorphobacter fuscus]MQT16351.1 transcriptional repressor LexA [Polymorphobacter fuscus]
MLTRKQQELLVFIDQRLQADGVSPSFEEMKDALQLRSKSGVHRLINALEERRFIRRLPNRARALEVLQMPDAVRAPLRLVPPAVPPRPPVQAMIAANDTVVVPLHGRIAAGLPVEALESDRSLSVPAALLGPGDHYALEVSGDSMIDAGIFDGDYALVRRCDDARDGDIVVALIDEAEATLKYLHREKGHVRLDPANAAFEPQRYPANRVRVQGKLAGLLRRYH